MNRRDFMRHASVAGLGLSVGLGVAEAADPAEVAGQSELFLPVVQNGAANGAMAILVAASDAPAIIRSSAQYVCDGLDDQLEINQAVTDLSATGGLVQLSEGTFVCSSAVRLQRRIYLRGKGRSTILEAVGSWNAYDGTTPGGLIEPFDGGVDKTAVSSLTLSGKRYQGANVKGIYYNITSSATFDEGPDAAHRFSDLYIFQTQQHGFHITGSRMRASQIRNVRVYNVGSEGETVAHGFYIACPDSFLSQCESGSSSGSGFFVDGANNRFTNCKSWYSDLSGWQILQPRGQYAACESQDNAQHGFYITTGPNSLTSCHADSNSWEPNAPTASYDGFHIPWGSRIQLIGCAAYDKNEGGRGNWQRFGFFVGSSAEYCQILGVVADNSAGATGGSGMGGATNLLMITGQ